MKYQLSKDIKDNDVLRKSFIELAIKTFDLSFEKWYEEGYWTNKYIPYLLFDGDKAIANVSVNIMHTKWNGYPKKYIQIGTVMTDPEYRNQGLSSFLIEEVLNDWKYDCDAVYLFANPTVLDFYPKFGFKQEMEYQYCSLICSNKETLHKLNMSLSHDRNLLLKYYRKGNPFSVLPMIDNYGLLMFYCSAFMKNDIYYSEAFDAVIVAGLDDGQLTCYDIFCDENKQMPDVLSCVTNKEITRVTLGFTPKITDGFDVKTLSGDTLFVLQNKENPFQGNKLMFPVLSHA